MGISSINKKLLLLPAEAQVSPNENVNFNLEGNSLKSSRTTISDSSVVQGAEIEPNEMQMTVSSKDLSVCQQSIKTVQPEMTNCMKDTIADGNNKKVSQKRHCTENQSSPIEGLQKKRKRIHKLQNCKKLKKEEDITLSEIMTKEREKLGNVDFVADA